MTIAEERNPHNGLNGILTQYHVRFCPYLGIGRCEIRRMPCAFIDHINSMDLPCDTYLVPKYQPRYSSVIKCKYYPVLGKHDENI